EQLGLPVVPIQANKGRGLDRLRRALWQAVESGPPAKLPAFPEAFEREVETLRHALGRDVETFLIRRLLLDVGGHTERRLTEQFGPGIGERVKAARQRLAEAGCAVPAVEARTRYGWIRPIPAACVTRPDQRPVTWTDRLDRVLTHKLWGTLIFL